MKQSDLQMARWLAVNLTTGGATRCGSARTGPRATESGASSGHGLPAVRGDRLHAVPADSGEDAEKEMEEVGDG